MKSITQFSSADIDQLIQNKTEEDINLEFKQQLPGNAQSDKHELCADVSAFANTSGGVIFFGIAENNGAAESVKGIVSSSIDQEIARIEQIIHSGTEPPIPGITCTHLKASDGSSVVATHIPKSWNQPHLTTSNQSFRLYIRTNRGKRPLDPSEIRDKYNSALTALDEIGRWRDKRVLSINANEGPVRLPDISKLVLHLVPFEALSSPYLLNAAQLKEHSANFRPIGVGGWDNRINLDGYLSFGQSGFMRGRTDPETSYCQAFRSGAVEFVYSGVASEHNSKLLIASVWYEKAILEATADYLSTMGKLGVNFPFVVMLTLLNAKGARMATSSPFGPEGDPIDRDVILFPELLIESLPNDLPAKLRSVFDSVWNACGISRSLNYNNDGEWTGEQLSNLVPRRIKSN